MPQGRETLSGTVTRGRMCNKIQFVRFVRFVCGILYKRVYASRCSTPLVDGGKVMEDETRTLAAVIYFDLGW